MNNLSFLKPKSKIALIAPSFGCQDEPYKSRLEQAIKHFEQLGYDIQVSPLAFRSMRVESAPPKERADDFMRAWLDEDIDFIFSVSGGELMNEILDYLDFEVIKKASHPKFLLGYSDNTNLSFLLPVLADIPAFYGPHFPEFGCLKWDDFVKQTYDFITGKIRLQHSFDYYQSEDLRQQSGHFLDSINADQKSEWKSLDKKRSISLEGRLIGGCLDVLLTLIGTKYDKVADFVERYKDEGIVWFLETYALSVLDTCRALWQLKNAGWFKYCKGLVIGRPLQREALYDFSYEEALTRQLKDLGVPVLYDIDVGHVPPSITLVNGSYSRICYRDGKGTIEFLKF